MIKFGTDGIRGAANVELTPEVAMLIGKCVAWHLAVDRRYAIRRVVLGKDTRVSGDMLECALMAGICSAGADAWRVGIVPTPALAYLTRTLHCDCGIMISASHNPVEDNGIKIFSSEGYKLDADTEATIEQLMEQNAAAIELPTGDNVGCIVDKMSLSSEYINYVKRMMRGCHIEGPIVIDCAYGAASKFGKRIFDDRAEKVIYINSDEDGKKINVDCGSTRPEKLRKKVLQYGAKFGFAFDGDADRCIFIDEKGEIIDGDQIMLIAARDLVERRELNENMVVSTVMSNMGLEKSLEQLGAKMIRTSVGDKYVLREMQTHDYDLGGEQSGHVIFRRLSTTGDGLITAAQVLRIVATAKAPLSELAAIERSAQVLKNIRVPDKEAFYSNVVIQAKVREIEDRLGSDGRVVVRPSGTEPKIRVMIETWDQSTAESCCDEILDTVRTELKVS